MNDLSQQHKSLIPATRAGQRLLEWASTGAPITIDDVLLIEDEMGESAYQSGLLDGEGERRDLARRTAAEWAAWIVRSGRMPDGACPECGPVSACVEEQRCIPHEALAYLVQLDEDQGPSK